MERGKPPFPESLLMKPCTHNSKEVFNRPMGEGCELRHLISNKGELRVNAWSCLGCNAIFTRKSQYHIARDGEKKENKVITKKYRVQIPDEKAG